MNFCTECGAKLSDNAAFCHICGYALVQSQIPFQPPISDLSDRSTEVKKTDSFDSSKLPVRFWLLLVGTILTIASYLFPWAYMNTYGLLSQHDTSFNLFSLYCRLDDVSGTLDLWGGKSSELEIAIIILLLFMILAIVSGILLVISVIQYRKKSHAALANAGFTLSIFTSSIFVLAITILNSSVETVIGVTHESMIITAFPYLASILSIICMLFFVRYEEGASSFVKNMTKGSPLGYIVKIAIPVIMASILQSLLSQNEYTLLRVFLEDTVINMHVFSITNMAIHVIIVSCLFIPISIVVAIMVSQYYGAKDKENLSKAIGNTLLLIFCVTLLIMVFGTLFTSSIARWFDPMREIIELTIPNLRVLFLGIAGIAFYYTLFGVMCGLGDVIFPSIMLFFSLMVRTELSIWFVAKFSLGVTGFALAAVISYLLLAAICFVRIMQYTQHGIVKISYQSVKPSKVILGKTSKMALPLVVSSVLYIVTNVSDNVLIGHLGTPIFAARNEVIRLNSFIPTISFGLSRAAVAFIGQNIGSCSTERVNRGKKTLLLSAIAVSVFLVVPTWVIMRRAIATTEATPVTGALFVTMACQVINYVVITNIFTLFAGCACGLMQGAGSTLPTMWNALIVFCISFVLSRVGGLIFGLGLSGILSAEVIASVLGCVFVLLYICKGHWEKKGLISTLPNR